MTRVPSRPSEPGPLAEPTPLDPPPPNWRRVDWYASVETGLSTGDRDFFLRRRHEWLELGFSDADIIPALGDPALVDGPRLSSAAWRRLSAGERVYLLALGPGDAKRSELARLVESDAGRTSPARAAGGRWWLLGRRDPCSIYVERRTCRILRNESPAIALNDWLTIERRPNVAGAELLAGWSRTPDFAARVALYARMYPSARLEPAVLASVPVPPFEEIVGKRFYALLADAADLDSGLISPDEFERRLNEALPRSLAFRLPRYLGR